MIRTLTVVIATCVYKDLGLYFSRRKSILDSVLDKAISKHNTLRLSIIRMGNLLLSKVWISWSLLGSIWMEATCIVIGLVCLTIKSSTLTRII